MATTNRIMEVYKVLGQILSNPLSFGLNHRAPKSLVDALTTARRELMEELGEKKRWPAEDEDSLASELSQDADRPSL